MICLYCDCEQFDYVKTVWDTDLGAYMQFWRCINCREIHGDVPDTSEWDDVNPDGSENFPEGRPDSQSLT